MIEVPVERQLVSDMEKLLQKEYDRKAPDSRLPSSAGAAPSSERHDQLVLPVELRGRMPFTQDKYLVKENPQLVEWERETRLFLRQLSPIHGHRVSAVMVYEWATGINVAELYQSGGSANSDIRKITKCLKFYFGKPYSTYIAGRKVPNCFKVRPGYYIKRHRPMTLALYSEYCEKTLAV